MNIKITDERIEQVIPVALENINAEIVEAKEQTFETLDEKGEVVLTTLNVIQSRCPTKRFVCHLIHHSFFELQPSLFQYLLSDFYMLLQEPFEI